MGGRMSDKRVLTVLYLTMLLIDGALRLHREYASGISEIAIPIVMRLLIAIALTIAVGTERYGTNITKCAAVQGGVFYDEFSC